MGYTVALPTPPYPTLFYPSQSRPVPADASHWNTSQPVPGNTTRAPHTCTRRAEAATDILSEASLSASQPLLPISFQRATPHTPLQQCVLRAGRGHVPSTGRRSIWNGYFLPGEDAPRWPCTRLPATTTLAAHASLATFTAPPSITILRYTFPGRL
ncbi:hypothetical protein E2C01_071255 [Portunus trituberculatus]|uniref:Uncharacterized protein n=1 Tax=Portunus trituberculatus TaxID=210409 RepID=A0A5B7I3I1_PORTR|nr:hypothetical protein [Portunus trituberculatus]